MMNDKTKLLCLLDRLALSYRVRLFALDNFDENVVSNGIEKYKQDILREFDEGIYLKLKNAISAENIAKTALELEKYGVKAISYEDKEYPENLKNTSDFPICLYYKGDISIIKNKSVAIIGTRKPTFYGRDVTRLFASELSKAGLVTVSGLAYGLDSEVADATLNAKGKTVAVLGGGLDSIYPASNVNLAEKIVASGGLLLSEYPLFRRPTKYSFTERNRIISGISEGVVIVEAGKKSGTLNTAMHAIEQGKEIFTIPGSIFSSASEGTNYLISELPETFTISPAEVLKRLKIEPLKKQDSAKNKLIMEDEKLIVNTLYEGEMDFDTIQMKTSIEPKSLISLLTRMEISGLIKKLPGNFYCL